MSSLFSLDKKVALVTGGAQGLGRMIAAGLIGAGAKVYITSRKREVCEAAARELAQAGACVGLAADLNTPEAVVALANEIKAREPQLHILINNAGRTWGAPLETFPDKAWAGVMAVNVQGPFTLVRELLPLLAAAAVPDDPARIINIGSLAGLRAEPLSAYSYAASKAAIQHLSRVLAKDLAARHITVNSIIPGYFPTQMTAHIRGQEAELNKLLERVPLGRLGEPDDIVGACVFLASRAGRYVTAADLVVDGGMAGCG
ncbi:MAG TPA: SDR family oxidoreductase [Steroidobacteraceae bacterium]|nr:SDR family oxidoreductase [Steroidobacteraceae bacterium]